MNEFTVYIESFNILDRILKVTRFPHRQKFCTEANECVLVHFRQTDVQMDRHHHQIDSENDSKLIGVLNMRYISFLSGCYK